MAVFDLFDPKTKEDGLYYILNKTNDSPPVTNKELGDFKQTEEKLPRGTTWILRNQEMHERLWIQNSKDCLYRAMSSYHERAPNGRIHCVFLVLSEENLREMADIIDSCVSIIGTNANKCITILSEKKEAGLALTKLLQPEVRKDLKTPCSIIGFPLEFLRKSVEEMLGDAAYEDATAKTDLPFWNGKFKPILNKRINSLTDLEVYFPKPKLSSSFREVKAARDNFYKGEVIKQLNLDNNDDIERTLATVLTQRIDRSLKILSGELPDDTAYVEIVLLSYESGSGATTLGRRILWNKRVFYRCAIVKAITENTDHQIQELQRFGYETSQAIIPPVLILVDNFPEHLVQNLREKLFRRNTKCVLLNTIPIAIQLEKKSRDNCLKLGKLDPEEIQRVQKILANVEDKNEREKDAAVEKIKREKRFIWLGLELFGQQYNKIRKRLSDHIHDIIISSNVANQIKGAYKMILYFCCLLDYYSKGRSIYPHPCITDILYAHDDLKNDDMNQIEKIHDKFGGLLLEDYSETEGYHGWRPAHFLVGEVVHEEMDFLETAKLLLQKMNSGEAYAKTFLINNTVNVFLKREKISESSSQNINDTDFILDGISGADEPNSLEVQTRYSALVMEAMPNENFPCNILKALDLLVTLIENVHTTQHKARTWQQIARLFAYEIGMREISEKIEPLVIRVNEELQLSDQSLNCSTATIGFAIAHQIIDHAIDMQKSFVNHLVTKATFFKVKLRDLYEQAKDISAKNEETKEIMAEAISTTKKGIQAYDNALESPEGYLHAMVGKIQTIIVLLQIFKTHPCFSQNNMGPDESFKNYITIGSHPAELKETLTEDDLDFFLSLADKVIHHLNDFFHELKITKRQYEKNEKQELINAKIRAMALRKKFYQVTHRNERTINSTGCKEDIVHDLLYEHEETPYSTWKKLPADVITRIYDLLKHAIPKGPVSRDSMLICARAALETNVTVDAFFQHIQLWSRHFPKSVWCHMFNYMIHFPVPSGALKSNVQIVKQSADFCKKSHPRIRERYRKSGAEYLLGRGIGLNAILSSHKVSPDSVEHKIDFWRSFELYEKLERLRGEKILGKKGVLAYKGIEIMFDNDRYPKESRDELWFCLGFTLNGPYAYDPIDDDTYKRMKDDFEKKKVNASQASGNSQESRTDERTLKTAWQNNNQTLLNAGQCFAQPGNRKSEKANVDAMKQNLEKKAELPVRKVERYTDQYVTEGEFRNNRSLAIIKRSKEGDQKTFTPKFKDQDGKIHHGAFVKGAPKSSECRRHQKNTDDTRNCTFAHTWKEDYIQQTVCEICTKSKLFFCNCKDERSRKIYVLGRYYDEFGQYWLPPNPRKQKQKQKKKH